MYRCFFHKQRRENNAKLPTQLLSLSPNQCCYWITSHDEMFAIASKRQKDQAQEDSSCGLHICQIFTARVAVLARSWES